MDELERLQRAAPSVPLLRPEARDACKEALFEMMSEDNVRAAKAHSDDEMTPRVSKRRGIRGGSARRWLSAAAAAVAVAVGVTAVVQLGSEEVASASLHYGTGVSLGDLGENVDQSSILRYEGTVTDFWGETSEPGAWCFWIGSAAGGTLSLAGGGGSDYELDDEGLAELCSPTGDVTIGLWNEAPQDKVDAVLAELDQLIEQGLVGSYEILPEMEIPDELPPPVPGEAELAAISMQTASFKATSSVPVGERILVVPVERGLSKQISDHFEDFPGVESVDGAETLYSPTGESIDNPEDYFDLVSWPGDFSSPVGVRLPEHEVSPGDSWDWEIPFEMSAQETGLIPSAWQCSSTLESLVDDVAEITTDCDVADRVMTFDSCGVESESSEERILLDLTTGLVTEYQSSRLSGESFCNGSVSSDVAEEAALYGNVQRSTSATLVDATPVPVFD